MKEKKRVKIVGIAIAVLVLAVALIIVHEKSQSAGDKNEHKPDESVMLAERTVAADEGVRLYRISDYRFEDEKEPEVLIEITEISGIEEHKELTEADVPVGTAVTEDNESEELVLLDEAPEINEEELEMLACVIYQEAGGNACSDLCRYMVGDVVLNRIADEEFPNTMEGVLTQKQQYGRFYWTGVKWPARASNPGEANAVERAYETARALLSGEHSDIYGQGYVWQAEFKQGKDIIYLDGMYFGRK